MKRIKKMLGYFPQCHLYISVYVDTQFSDKQMYKRADKIYKTFSYIY